MKFMAGVSFVLFAFLTFSVCASGEKLKGTIGFEGQEFQFHFRSGRAASDAPELPDPKDPAIDRSLPSPVSIPTSVSPVPMKSAGGTLTPGPAGQISKDGFQVPPDWGVSSAVEDVRSDNRIVFRDITFDLNSANLKSESYPTLRRLLMIIQSNSGSRFLIEGHTDSNGDDATNQQLSIDRAESVKTWLVSNGIEATRLTTQGFGETKPAVSNDTSEGRAQNRRVEVVRQ